MEPKPEVEYYISNAGAHAPLKILAQVAGAWTDSLKTEKATWGWGAAKPAPVRAGIITWLW